MTWSSTLASPLAAVAIPWAARWVASRRRAHRPGASPIGPAERSALEPHFAGEVLDRARVRRVPAIEPPSLLSALGRLGLDLPLTGGRIQGIAFDDTILLLERIPPRANLPLLFHELVHVAQYRLLGIRGFVERYVRGWIENGGRYRDIPLERIAYELQRRFVEDPAIPIAVDQAVADPPQ
ncbi:MAG: hypothetical protein R3199_06960 [Gemmatimonadota bacterium]|nr:hypothetical protein [Gemmatimonadota bacterium]